MVEPFLFILKFCKRFVVPTVVWSIYKVPIVPVFPITRLELDPPTNAKFVVPLKFPFKVNVFAPIANLPAVKIKLLLIVFEALSVTVPVLIFVIPPVATNGVIHSCPANLAVDELYCNVAAVP